MVRTLWTAATGMIGQQTNVDTIANNLANVNTVGYKTETNEFKSLLYQTIQTKTTSANGDQKPVGAQVGLGVRNSAIVSQFTQGAYLESESPTAFAIGGKGLFGVHGNDGKTYYTRNGDLRFAVGGNNTMVLTTSDGNPVLNSNGGEIRIPNTYITTRIEVDVDGYLMYPDAQNNMQRIPGMQIGLWQFQNPSGLDKEGDSLYGVTAASRLLVHLSRKGIIWLLKAEGMDARMEPVSLISFAPRERTFSVTSAPKICSGNAAPVG